MSANPTPATTQAQPPRTKFPRFSLGQIVATPGAREALYEADEEAIDFLKRHLRLEQGELCADDHALNERALIDGSRIFSAFKTVLDEKVWIITEATGDDGQRASTCILLPSEY